MLPVQGPGFDPWSGKFCKPHGQKNLKVRLSWDFPVDPVVDLGNYPKSHMVQAKKKKRKRNSIVVGAML